MGCRLGGFVWKRLGSIGEIALILGNNFQIDRISSHLNFNSIYQAQLTGKLNQNWQNNKSLSFYSIWNGDSFFKPV